MHPRELALAIERVRSEHFPNDPASVSAILNFERQEGVELPDDMRIFYSACNGARLFGTYDSPHYFVPIEKLCRARVAIFDRDENELGPASIYAFCDVRDGNYVGVDLDPTSPNAFCTLDCFHETFPDPIETVVITKSFGEFLTGCLESGGKALWWLRQI